MLEWEGVYLPLSVLQIITQSNFFNQEIHQGLRERLLKFHMAFKSKAMGSALPGE